ncbi:hypothetical protein [Marivita sp. XM-24bin2]|jgi:hypothetical protein|uniref:hypothetical protein n=1 Tax=Marivita sp. XM-24bin2 TaxID=2133951 RepID=UPI0025C6D8A1|nr:hypothetical protein [Marivita sp. XM-24bin2]
MLLSKLKASAILVLFAIPNTALAQGFGPGFSSSYQFRSDNDRAVKSGVVDLIEKKKAGMYQAPIFNSTTTTNVAGDQINCDLAATTIGNSGSAITDGSSGAPSVLNSPTVQAASAGNQSGREESGPLNSSGGSNTINTTQDVSGLTQSSSVDTSTQGGVSGEVGGSSSALSQESENDQSVAGSPLNSHITSSSACSWK